MSLFQAFVTKKTKMDFPNIRLFECDKNRLFAKRFLEGKTNIYIKLLETSIYIYSESKGDHNNLGTCRDPNSLFWTIQNSFFNKGDIS